MPSELQKKFIHDFTEEFFREIQFLVDVKSGRANKRKTFFEKLIGKIDDINDIVNVFVGFFPIIKDGVSSVQKTINGVIKTCKFICERNVDANMDALLSGTQTPELILKILLEKAARQLARRHEFFINHRCAPESINLFATVGVARVLRYLADTKGVEFNLETILKAAIEGRSGSGQQGFKNNKLKIKGQEKTVDAETVYGRSAHMDLSGDYYFDRDPPLVTLRTTYGYVEKANGLPIAGVMVLNDAELAEYRFDQKPLSVEMEAYLNHYRPKFRYIGRSEVETYLRERRASGDAKSLAEFYQADEIICRGSLAEMDLSGGDFTEATFLGCDLTHTHLEGAVFEHAYMVGADLSQARGRANFRGANLSLVNAAQAELIGSDFTGVKMWHASLKGAKLEGIHYLGADCYGTDFSDIHIEEAQRLELSELQNTTQELLFQQRFQAERIQALETSQQNHTTLIQDLDMQYHLIELELRLSNEKMTHLQEELQAYTDDSFREKLQADILSLEGNIRELESTQALQIASITRKIHEFDREYYLELDLAKRELLVLKTEQQKYAQISFVDNLLAQIASLEIEIQECYTSADSLRRDFSRMSEKLARVEGVFANQVACQSMLDQRMRALESLSHHHADEMRISRRRLGEVEERVASQTHETRYHLDVHDQRLKALEQWPVSLVASGMFSHASASTSRSFASEIGIDADFEKVCEILRDYPPFPGIQFSLERGVLYYQVPDEKDYLTVHRFLREWKMLEFSASKIQRGARPYVKLSLKTYDLSELERGKQELPGLFAWIKNNRERGHQDYEADIIKYTKTLQANPQDMKARRVRASAYRHLGRYEEAIQDYSVLIEQDYRNKKLYCHRGVCFSKCEDYEQALQDLNTALTMDPTMRDALFEKGRILYELSDHDEALRFFNLLLRQSSKNLEAYFYQGLCFQKLGERAKSERLQKEYLKKSEAAFLRFLEIEKQQSTPRRGLVEACELALLEIEARKNRAESSQETFSYVDRESSIGSDASFFDRYRPEEGQGSGSGAMQPQ